MIVRKTGTEVEKGGTVEHRCGFPEVSQRKRHARVGVWAPERRAAENETHRPWAWAPQGKITVVYTAFTIYTSLGALILYLKRLLANFPLSLDK